MLRDPARISVVYDGWDTGATVGTVQTVQFLKDFIMRLISGFVDLGFRMPGKSLEPLADPVLCSSATALPVFDQ